LYLDRLRVRSLKLLKDFELGFTREDGSPRMWTAIVVVDHDPETGNVERFVHDASGRLVPQASGSHARSGAPDPRAMTGTDLYRQWFDLDRLTLNPQGAKLREYLSLATDPLRTDEEDERTKKLERELSRAGVHQLREPVDRQGSEEGGTEAGFEEGHGPDDT
jgi:hypothetical protein